MKHALLVCSLLTVASALAGQASDSTRVPRDTSAGRAPAFAPVRTTTDLLVGRILGVVVSPASGLTGAGNRVRIRGHASLFLGNRPVVYVDGVRIEGMAHDRTMFDRAPSSFDDINPDAVDSIVVVRGPAAGGIYGPEAATGVLLVFTNRGHIGPPRWHAYAEEGRLWDGTDWPANYGGVDADSPDSLYRNGGCTLDAQARGFCAQDFIQSFSPLEARSQFRTAPRRRAGLSVIGGAGRILYAGGVDAEGEAGIYKLSRAETDRLTAQGFEIRDHIREPNNLRRLRGHAKVGVRVTSATELEVWGSLGSRSLRPGLDLPLLANGLRGYSDPALNDGWVTRPGQLFQTERTQEVDHRTAGMRLTSHVNRFLTVTALAGWHRHDVGELRLTRYGEGRFPGEPLEGAIALENAAITHRTLSVHATAEYGVRGLAARSTLGVRHTKRDVYDSTFSGVGLPPGVTDPDSTTAFSLTVQREQTPLLAFFVAQRFAWRDRVAVALGLRADHRGIPRVEVFPFPPRGGGSDWTIHPSVEVEWAAARPPSGALTRLDVRAAYGSADQRVEGSFLSPERTEEGELGARAELWEGRAALDAAFYARRLTDGLVVVAFGGLAENVLRVHNTGIELGLTIAPLRRYRLSWTVGLAAWGNRNRVRSLAGANVGFNQANRPGYPYAGYWGRGYTYADANGDGVIGRFEVMSDTGPEAIRYLGNPFPSHGASLSNSLTILGRVHVSGLFEYRAGHQLLNRTAWGRCISNVCRELHDPNTSLERQAVAMAGTGAGPFGGFNGSGFIEHADFVKLRELAVTVSLPTGVASRIGAGSASVTLVGRNLLMWTRYSGADPEAIALLRPEETGVRPFGPLTAAGFAVEDFMVQPTPRVWALRLDVRF